MDFLNQVASQLTKMSENEKDEWILSQAKLHSEHKQKDFLLSLSGDKKVVDMPTLEVINNFCEQVESGEIYFEYETHYHEFHDDGRYMDDWESWHNDIFGTIPFLNRVFAGCHNLLCLEEYQTVSDILCRVCELRFPVREAEDSEGSPDKEVFSLTDADKESMFSKNLSTVGEDWIRAVIPLIKEQDNQNKAKKLIEMLEHPVCQKVRPRILVEAGITPEVFSDMATILEGEIAVMESVIGRKFQKNTYSREQYKLLIAMNRKKEILSDIRVKCLNVLAEYVKQKDTKLVVCWKQFNEGIRWLSYEKIIDDQPEIDGVLSICEGLIAAGQLEQEDWEVRKRVLEDIIKNKFYDYYQCGDAITELAEKLCTNEEEYLAYADIMDASGIYREKAASLYHQYGRDDKYVSYLEDQLNQRSKEYSTLITYYQEHNQQENARRVAELGLERCKEDLTDMFICLLSDAKKEHNQKRFQKFYASAKRRKHVDIERVNRALQE